mmetsp:Transcript_31205/g.75432  ORF Transcript_31205/g.75432 Transcript_31205/m.75432 type:complete len:461 (-) Transcript_31205:309-1691(-)
MERHTCIGTNARDEYVAARSKDVKERIGPIVQRLKISLETIQKLEDSLNDKRLCTIQEDEGERPGPDNNSSSKFPGPTDRNGTLASSRKTSQHFVPGQSRKLMQSSMEMVKRKLMKLKSMEEMLVESEDRRSLLEHQMLQITTTSNTAATTALKVLDDSKEVSLRRRIGSLQQDIRVLETKCGTVDEVTRERDRLLEDLAERQRKIQTLSIQCDDLHCHVDRLTVTSTELVDALKRQEDRAVFLEEELLESRKYGTIPFIRSSTAGSSYSGGPPQTIHSDISRESPVSPYLQSEGESGSDGSGANGHDMDCSSLPSISDSDNGTMNDVIDSQLPISYKPANRQPTAIEDAMNDPQADMIQRLLKKVEALDRENAELRESKERIAGKYQASLNELKKRASLIQEIQRNDVAVVDPIRGGDSKMVQKIEDGAAADAVVTVVEPKQTEKRGNSLLQRLRRNGL